MHNRQAWGQKIPGSRSHRFMHLENSQRRHGDLSKAIIGHLPWDGGTPPVSVLHSSILAFIKEERRWGFFQRFSSLPTSAIFTRPAAHQSTPQNRKAQGTKSLGKKATLLTHCIVIRSHLASFLIRACPDFFDVATVSHSNMLINNLGIKKGAE
jgi:hypothetical protein